MSGFPRKWYPAEDQDPQEGAKLTETGSLQQEACSWTLAQLVRPVAPGDGWVAVLQHEHRWRRVQSVSTVGGAGAHVRAHAGVANSRAGGTLVIAEILIGAQHSSPLWR